MSYDGCAAEGRRRTQPIGVRVEFTGWNQIAVAIWNQVAVAIWNQVAVAIWVEVFT
ncbi:hypothetical protein LJC08_03270 [Methanimicrococcus sp. OttesenSCG-928-J09]|nr:hypothetical protein [Methanimicrococcus sp. OttesenSCG-928-J09]